MSSDYRTTNSTAHVDRNSAFNAYLDKHYINSSIGASLLGYDYFAFLYNFAKEQDKKFIQDTLNIKLSSDFRIEMRRLSVSNGRVDRLHTPEQIFERIISRIESYDLMAAVKLNANKPRIIDSIDYCYSAIFDVISKANRLYYD